MPIKINDFSWANVVIPFEQLQSYFKNWNKGGMEALIYYMIVQYNSFQNKETSFFPEDVKYLEEKKARKGCNFNLEKGFLSRAGE